MGWSEFAYAVFDKRRSTHVCKRGKSNAADRPIQWGCLTNGRSSSRCGIEGCMFRAIRLSVFRLIVYSDTTRDGLRAMSPPFADHSESRSYEFAARFRFDLGSIVLSTARRSSALTRVGVRPPYKTATWLSGWQVRQVQELQHCPTLTSRPQRNRQSRGQKTPLRSARGRGLEDRGSLSRQSAWQRLFGNFIHDPSPTWVIHVRRRSQFIVTVLQAPLDLLGQCVT